MLDGNGARIIRVGIADDHPIVRRSLAYLLRAHHDIRLVGEASSGREAINLVRTSPMEVLVLDLEMPDQSGMDALRSIKACAQLQGLGVLVFSAHPESRYAVRLIRNGAAGYLNKSCAPADIIEAIRRTASGRRYITPVVAELLANEVLAPTAPNAPLPPEALSLREMQTLVKFARGRRPREVASELSLSPKTVSAYRSALMRKLKTRSEGELAYYAMTHRLLD